LKKQYIFLVSVAVIFLLLAGCGGGIGGGPTPPAEYKITVSVSPSEVYEEEETHCWAEVQPTPPVGVVIKWKQFPSSPAGSFEPLQGESVIWKAPLDVPDATTFSLVAYFELLGKTYEGSATIVVLPKGSPPVNPPSISIEYPSDEQVVGSGTLLTVLGSIYQGSSALRELQVLDSDGTILQRWSVSSSGAFRVDLSNFGSPGRKTIRVRAVDSAGLYAEQTLQIVNDDGQLDGAAREFLRKYCSDAYGRTIRFGELTTGPYTVPVNVYLDSSLSSHLTEVKDALEEAEKFWKHYTGIEFRYINSYPPRPQDPKTPVIGIGAWWDKEGPGGAVAVTTRGSQQDVHELTDVGIVLYKGWLSWPQDTQIGALTHELGHALVTASEIEEFGFRCVLWPILTSVNDQIIPTIMQRAVHLLYNNSPGWQP